MTFDEAIAYWFSRINYEVRAARPGDLNLDRMRTLLQQLGNPHQRLRIVHVAGSKGKGSTSAMLAAILQRAGYRTGLFTSPHLSRVEERFRVNGVDITPAELIACMEEIRAAVLFQETRKSATAPTFFEIATALGFLHFVHRRVEVAVLEVGLGGRLDSTNVCRPLVAAITSISHDHIQQLGPTLGRIAWEKAGIVKPGVPTVSGVTGAEAQAVIADVCRSCGAPLVEAERDFHAEHQPGQVTASATELPEVRIVTRQRRWPSLKLGLLGAHQAANAAVAVACIEHLRAAGLSIPDDAVARGLAEVVWPARLEVLRRQPLIVVDCAHNVASVQALIDTLKSSFPSSRRLLVFAGSNDKDLEGMLRVLAPHFARIFLTRFSASPRSVPPEQLLELLSADTRGTATCCPTAPAALEAALAQTGPQDLLCITGSVFLAGELRPMLMR